MKLLNLVKLIFVYCDPFLPLLKLIEFVRLNEITLLDFDEVIILNLIVLLECD